MLVLLALLLIFFASVLLANGWVVHRGSRWVRTLEEATHAQTAIVLGAFVFGDKGFLSPVLRDRVDTAIAVFKAGKVDTLLMSGDHGEKDYDEVNAMRRYAEEHGVPGDKIFLDHAGFTTFDSMARARLVFQVESAIIVTNGFHMPRALLLAESQGLQVQGVVAQPVAYQESRHDSLREVGARCKAFAYVYFLHPQPDLLGPPIPITGDARASHDK